ncbi:peptidoglycan-binding domain-containing protein [Streptomyces viridochromogenes]|uniref:Putative membrane protein n=1 Tax=Streptomyces viridochromogenes Tue57 TaxID=1160705 RepID=L8P3I0_STRVR|nr:peptidoglycan-binding domain-containing protein [Streptomyces viridochromogenes]ELS50714.1 putative membrane protein [Streptomyces viridochromogenes Tue57]
MSEPNGPGCPECGTPRASDGTPACSCGRLASDARRETRTAEAAAAEDFDPVRIRPFVELGDGSGETEDPGGAPPPARSSTSAPGVEPGLAEEPRRGEPGRPGEATHARAGSRRGRHALLLGGAVAALAVVLTGAVVGGLLSYDGPSRDGALPDGVRAPVPDGSADGANSPGEQSDDASSTSAAQSPTSSPSTSPTHSAADPTRSATPTEAPSGPAGTGSASAAPGPSASEEQPPVLRFGDQGPEVTELQLRLRQLGFYGGDIDGEYDREVENSVRGYQFARLILGDEPGVYGSATRASLESETAQP